MAKFKRSQRNNLKRRSVRARKQRRTRRTQLRNKTSVPVGLGFPKRMVMTHKYADSLALTSTLGAIGKHLFSCNGMFDPNASGGGHQPLYYDQMAALYNHYTIIGSRIKLTVTPQNSTEDTYYIGCWLDDDTTTTNITSLTDIAERTSGKLRLISSNSNNVYRFSNNWSAKKTFGGSILGNDNLQGTIGANPAENTYFGIGIQTASANTAVCEVLIEITYIAVWEELKDVAAS